MVQNNNWNVFFRQLIFCHFPGPLVPGQTHKGEVIQFCQSKIQHIRKYGDNIPDKESFVLLWEYLILLLRQKNTIDGSDIAELLLKDRDVHRPYRNQSSTKKSSVINNNKATPIAKKVKQNEASKDEELSDQSYKSDENDSEEGNEVIITQCEIS